MVVSSPDLKSFPLATPFFGGLSDASLDLLLSMLVERRFEAGATVVREGEPGRSLFIVHSGALAVSHSDIRARHSHAYVIVLQNINRELSRRLRRADKRIADLLRGE